MTRFPPKNFSERDQQTSYYRWSPEITIAIQRDEEFGEEMKKLIDGVLLLSLEEAG
jgi:hypothetical protein